MPVSEGLPRLAAGSIGLYRCFALPRLPSTLPEVLRTDLWKFRLTSLRYKSLTIPTVRLHPTTTPSHTRNHSLTR